MDYKELDLPNNQDYNVLLSHQDDILRISQGHASEPFCASVIIADQVNTIVERSRSEEEASLKVKNYLDGLQEVFNKRPGAHKCSIDEFTSVVKDKFLMIFLK